MSPTIRAPLALFLFRPFRLFAGMSPLIAGLAIITLTGWIGSAEGLHFDGVLDTQIGPRGPRGPRGPLWLFPGEGLINWLSLALPL